VRAPKVTFNVGFDYTKPTEIGDWTLSATYSRVSPYASSIVALPGQPGVTDPIANVQAQNKLGASLSWEHKLAAGDLRITVYGRNLLDERGLEGALEASGLWAFGFGREPRTFGVMANYKF
jgi:iron complex outermembrane receptor protein